VSRDTGIMQRRAATRASRLLSLVTSSTAVVLRRASWEGRVFQTLY